MKKFVASYCFKFQTSRGELTHHSMSEVSVEKVDLASMEGVRDQLVKIAMEPHQSKGVRFSNYSVLSFNLIPME